MSKLTFSLEEAIDREPSIENRESLNIFLVRLRPLVKTAKNQVIRTLTRRATLLNKKLKNNDNNKLSKKKENALLKLKVLSKINRDRLCKQILSLSLENHSLCVTDDMESKAVHLLYERPSIKREIEQFKAKNTDWMDLINYILYKNTSGKLKKRPQKVKASHRKGTIPLPQPPTFNIENNDPAHSTDSKTRLEQTSIYGRHSPMDESDHDEADSSQAEDADSVCDANNSSQSECASEEEKEKAVVSVDEDSDSDNALGHVDEDSDSDNPLGHDEELIKPAEREMVDRSDYRAKKQIFGGPKSGGSFKFNNSDAKNRNPHQFRNFNSNDSQVKQNWRPNQNQRKEFIPKTDPKPCSSTTQKPKDIHPSWKAKQEQKQKLQINLLTSHPTAKKIKFSD